MQTCSISNWKARGMKECFSWQQLPYPRGGPSLVVFQHVTVMHTRMLLCVWCFACRDCSTLLTWLVLRVMCFHSHAQCVLFCPRWCTFIRHLLLTPGVFHVRAYLGAQYVIVRC